MAAGVYAHTRAWVFTCDVDLMAAGVFGERGPWVGLAEPGELGMELCTSSADVSTSFTGLGAPPPGTGGGGR